MYSKKVSYKSPNFDKSTAELQDVYEQDRDNYFEIYRDGYGNRLEIHFKRIPENYTKKEKEIENN